MSPQSDSRSNGSVRFLELQPGEVPPPGGFWAVEYGYDPVNRSRLGGWLGQLDWWSHGLLSRKGLSLCSGGKADLFVGLDWMLSDGLLLIPSCTGEPAAAAREWAGIAVRRCAEMGIKNLSIGLNMLGRPGQDALPPALQNGWPDASGLTVTFWTGGLFDPLNDG